MKRSVVLLYGATMAAWRTDWEAEYEVLVLAGADAPLPAGTDEIEVVVSGETLPKTVVDALPKLALVACFSTGYAGIDYVHLRQRGIALTTAAGINAHDVADHAIALLLALWHRIPQADRTVHNGGWRVPSDARPSLKDKRAGVVGLGRIGNAVAARLAGHELAVRWWGPNPKPGAAFERAESLVALAKESDILVIASRADPENTHQISAEVLRALGPNGVLVNISRGFLVDEHALIAALMNGGIGGAALDVFEEEPPPLAKWHDVPNLVLTPHIAGFTLEAGKDLHHQQHENVRRYFAGEPLLTPVDGQN